MTTSGSTLLRGWGRTSPTLADVLPASSPEVVRDALRTPSPRGVLARGLGRSYGDAAQNAGGTVLDMTAWRGIESLDLEAGSVTVRAGTSIDDLLGELLPLGLFPSVTPGTRYVTVGGALAGDVHGKNHHVDGSFLEHVTAADLALPGGDVRTLGPGDPLLLATAGGMGLTGVLLRLTIRMLRVETSAMWVETTRARDLDELMSAMSGGADDDYRYSAAWLDCLSGGRTLGRGVLYRGDHATLDQLEPARRGRPLEPLRSARLGAPRFVPGGLLRRETIAVFNEAYYRAAPRHHVGLESIGRFFYPLDAVRDWNRIYGPRGFVQYQLVVPNDRGDVVRASLERLRAAGSPSFFGVLKRFGAGSAGHLSFPAPGWTLAVDLPASLPGLGPLLDGLDELVVGAGGRVYLSKDARLRPGRLAAMYPRLAEWRAVRDAADPDRVLVSDLARRVGLLGDRR